MKNKYYLITDDRLTKIVKTKSAPTMQSSGGTITSCSPAYDTKEELLEEESILEDPCKICGSVVSVRYCEPIKSEMTEKNICFFCHFWSGHAAKKNNKNIARIDGHHYMISSDTDRGFQGFGGRKFTIRFNDGREVVTRNLWSQGDIPEHFKEQLPDNAVFVHESNDG
jgi:hypothetical protein